MAPLAMGAVGDWAGNTDYSMALGALFATLLAILCLWNFIRQPIAARLARRDNEDYATSVAEGSARAVS
jgi:peptidoglycan/LPS O-acetylase OafA/YrhL